MTASVRGEGAHPDDWVTHNVFSKSKVKPFDLGLYAKEQSRVVKFEQPGPVEIFCWLHGAEAGVNPRADQMLREAGFRYLFSNFKVQRLA